MPGPWLFHSGCLFSGVGTTFLFLRAVPLLGALPPRRVLVKLAVCVLFSRAVFFMVSAAPQPVNSALFVLIPIVSALLYCLRSTDMFGEEQVLHTDKPFAPMFALLLVSIAFCSASFDLVRSFLLVDLESAASNLSQTCSGAISVFIFAAILIITLLIKPDAVEGAKLLYTTVVGVLAGLYVCMIAFTLFVFPDKNLSRILPPIGLDPHQAGRALQARDGRAYRVRDRSGPEPLGLGMCGGPSISVSPLEIQIWGILRLECSDLGDLAVCPSGSGGFCRLLCVDGRCAYRKLAGQSVAPSSKSGLSSPSALKNPPVPDAQTPKSPRTVRIERQIPQIGGLSFFPVTQGRSVYRATRSPHSLQSSSQICR